MFEKSSGMNYTPRISFFGKKNAIGIGKDVIMLLGFPSHIRIRINEENDSLVIEPTEEKEVMSFKVPDRFPFDRKCNFRIYSQQFVQNLMLSNGMVISKSLLRSRKLPEDTPMRLSFNSDGSRFCNNKVKN